MTETYGGKGKGKPPSRLRFALFAGILALASLAVLVRYILVMAVPSKSGSGGGTAATIERGPILDRNGRILALQTRLGNVTFWRPEAEDLPTLVQELGGILGMGPKDIQERISLSQSDFIYIKKKVDQSTIQAIDAARSAGRLKGVGIEPVVGRVYPEKNLAGQLLGFVGDGNEGLAGIEYAYDSQLSPRGGSLYGNQVILTIDANIQHILEAISQRSLAENKAEAVMTIAMDPRTGDILGYASLPDFDPNNIRESEEAARTDRPAMWAYEPGSVFKVFSMAAVLDSGAVSARSTFTCDGQYERTTNLGERVVIKCLGNHGTVGLSEIITYSCNAGAAYAADRMDSSSFHKALLDFGFGSKTGAGMPGETAGFLRPVERWSSRSKPTIAIGQEIAVSALQMVAAASAIANDGVLVQPKLISRILNFDGSAAPGPETNPPRRVLKPETARLLREYMASAASEAGTGRRAGIDDISLGVKTGTAQLINPATGAYSGTDFIASCIAVLPAEAPTLVLYHVIVKPKGVSYLGGRIAAPPIREAAEALVDYLGMPRGRNQQASHSGTVVMGAMDSPLKIGAVMPDFRGFSKRQLIPLLERQDLAIEISGDGWVRRQSPEPGAPVAPGATLRFELE
jgi:cell division protein FtsI (penicillin-binding protein 3)